MRHWQAMAGGIGLVLMAGAAAFQIDPSPAPFGGSRPSLAGQATSDDVPLAPFEAGFASCASTDSNLSGASGEPCIEAIAEASSRLEETPLGGTRHYVAEQLIPIIYAPGYQTILKVTCLSVFGCGSPDDYQVDEEMKAAIIDAGMGWLFEMGVWCGGAGFVIEQRLQRGDSRRFVIEHNGELRALMHCRAQASHAFTLRAVTIRGK